jgi:hypothetical protein
MKRGLNQENSLPDPEFGRESSESARAIHYVVQKDTLMTYEKGLFAQADPEIVSGSTIERKKMSTKTIYKRIALVAVAALGAGVLSVAPANAAISAIAVTQPANYIGKVGVAINVPVFVTTTGLAGAGETIIVTPTQSGATVTIGTSLVVVGTNTTIPDSGSTLNWTVAAATGVLTATADATSGAAIVAPTNQLGTLVLTPTRPGTTTITLTTTGTADDATATARTFTITTPTLAYDAGDAAVASPYDTGTGVAGVANTVTVEATSDNSVRSLVTVSGAGATINSATGSTSVALDKLSAVLAAAHTEIPVVINTPTVGTVTVSLYKETASAGIFSATASNTVTITVSAAPALTAGGINSATTTAALVAGATAGSTADAAVSASAAATAAGTAAAVVKIVLGQQSGAITGTTAISASVTGPGSLILDDTDGLGSPKATGRSLTSTITAMGAETFYVGVAPDGTSGVAVVTITAGTYSVTKSVTFYGKVAKLTATTKKNVANGTTHTGALDVVAYDAANVVVPSQAITITSGTTATIASFSATTSSAAEAAAGTAVVDVTAVAAKFGAVVLTIKDTATGLISTTATVNVGATEAKAVTAAFNKATYLPGELVTLTISATDTNGVAVGDAASVASSYTIVTSAAVQGTIPTAAEFKLGKQVVTFYAPLAAGPLTAEITLGATSAFAAAIQGTTVKASATVSDSATMSALTTLINSLIAKINALNKLVIKIQKKVKA